MDGFKGRGDEWNQSYRLKHQLVTLAMSALVAGLTVGGKAVGKTVAIRSCTDIVYLVGKILAAFGDCKQWLRKKKNRRTGG